MEENGRVHGFKGWVGVGSVTVRFLWLYQWYAPGRDAVRVAELRVDGARVTGAG